MIGAWAAVAVAAPALELPAHAPEVWREAAELAGFRLGACEGDCARLTERGLQVVWADGRTQEIPAVEPEVGLALARSQLALGPGAALRPSVPSRTPPAAPSESRIAAAQWVVAAVPPVGAAGIDAVRPATDFALSREVSATRVRPATTWWASAWAGASSGALLGAQVGVRRGPWLAGLGGRIDGSLTADAGVGVSGRVGPVQLTVGTWAGVEAWLTECFGCTVDVFDGGDQVEVTTTSLFWDPPNAAGMGPVARAEVQVGLPLGRRWTLAPRGGVAVSTVGTRPELAVAVIRTGR
ncbi:MAG: hypothetical protein KTR31_35090 [Myxococcales bacterium]|nr:hypothetical protein [Myxococcales bacterium]